MAEVERVDMDRSDEAWQVDLLEFVIDEESDRFGKCATLGSGGKALPVDIYRHYIVGLNMGVSGSPLGEHWNSIKQTPSVSP